MNAAATALAAMASCALLAACAAPPPPTPPLPQPPPPLIAVFELDRGPVDPLADPAARATVLLFTRSDCPISNRYAPEIARLHAEYGPRGVAFFLVYVDPDQSEDAVRAHVHDHGYACRVLLDRSHQLVALAGATITPEAALYLPGGRRVYRGRIDDRFVALDVVRAQPTCHDLAEAIDAALAGHAPEVAETTAIGCVIGDLHPRSPP
jgi:hypothetical protein